MAWEVELSDRVQAWQRSLDPIGAERFSGALDQLREMGPRLGRPFADTLKGARHHNLKELRLGNTRALYAFDARRHAVVLVAGDKTNDWKGWYQRNIPVADRMLDEHERGVRGGEQRWRAQGTGARSAATGR